MQCNHLGALRYARRSSQLCVQCIRCFQAVKTERHGGKLYIKRSDIPAGAAIFDWIEPSGVQELLR